MINKHKFEFFYVLNKKIIVITALLFLIVNVVLQYFFLRTFTNPGPNGDENGYKFLLERFNEFDLNNFSNSNTQPFIFISYLFNQFFDNPRFTIRFVSLLSSIICLGFLFYYYKKYKFVKIVENKLLNNLIIFNILFSVYFILEQHFSGASDALSVAFGLPGMILFIETILNKRNHNFVIIGALLALSFTTRPTILILFIAFFISLFLFYYKKIVSKRLILIVVFFVLWTALINYKPLINSGKIILDIKEVPIEYGTSWFEMNYLMAKKWDAGEIPNTQWLSHLDVIEFKKQNPDFIFPKNHLDILINDTGLFFRQMARMMMISLYSSFRYLYFLFPFLIFYYFLNSNKRDIVETRKVYFVVSFYFFALLLFMAFAFKLMEFRWMQIPIVIFSFYALHFSRNLTSEKRLVLINLVFLSGIGFFILKMLK